MNSLIRSKSNPRNILLLVALIATLFFYYLNQTQAIWQNPFPKGDEVAYLATAVAIREEGGLVSLIPRMITGDYKEANRHPFYVGLLSIFAHPSLDFFANAKAFNLVLGGIYLLLLFCLMRKLLGCSLAFLMVLLYAGNYFFLNQVAKVSTEPLLFIFVLLSWYLITEYGQKTDKKIVPSAMVASLSYLAKVTGIFVILSYLATNLIAVLTKKTALFSKIKLTAPTRKEVVLFIATVLVVASPLLWRNTLVYNNPFHNYNSKLLFIARGEERRTVEIYKGESQGLVGFIKEQSIDGTVGRLLRGMVNESVVFTQMVFFDYGRIRGSLILFGLFLMSMLRDRNRWRALYSVFLFSAFFIFFSWYYPISGHFRYVLPVLFIVYFYLFLLLKDFVKYLSMKWRWLAKFTLVTPLLLMLLGFYLIYEELDEHEYITPAHAHKVTTAYLDLASWIEDNITPETLYLNGPGHEFQVEWLTGTSEQSIEMPIVTSLSELNQFISDYGIKYVILSQPTITGRELILKDYFILKGDGLQEVSKPQGWALIAHEHRSDPRYLIYEIQ